MSRGGGPKRAAKAAEAAGAMCCLAGGAQATGAVGNCSACEAESSPSGETVEVFSASAEGSPLVGAAEVFSASACPWSRGKFPARAACNDAWAAAMATVASRLARLTLESASSEATPTASACAKVFSATAMSSWWWAEAAAVTFLVMDCQFAAMGVP